MRNSTPPRDIPPPLELECLKALWGMGEGSVRDVRQKLVGNRNLAYTTVMTVLDRLEKRGGVTRRKHGRFFVYTPNLSREALRRMAVREVVDAFFDGDEDALRQYLQQPAENSAINNEHSRRPDESMEAALL